MLNGSPKRWGREEFSEDTPPPPQNSRCCVAAVDNQALNPLRDPLQPVAQSRCHAEVAKDQGMKAPMTMFGKARLGRSLALPNLRSAGFQTCCGADFPVGATTLRPAGLETCGTADLEVCATLNSYQKTASHSA
jgi:hypothetical protein